MTNLTLEEQVSQLTEMVYRLKTRVEALEEQLDLSTAHLEDELPCAPWIETEAELNID